MRKGKYTMTDPLNNEVRDFINRAPPPRTFNGYRIHDYSEVRHRWLNEIAGGTIDQRINRRSQPEPTRLYPWHGNPSWYLVRKSINRHHRRELIKTYSGCRRLW